MEKTYIIDTANVLRSRNAPPRLAVNLVDADNPGIVPIVQIVLYKDNPSDDDVAKHVPGFKIVGTFVVQAADTAPAAPAPVAPTSAS